MRIKGSELKKIIKEEIGRMNEMEEGRPALSWREIEKLSMKNPFRMYFNYLKKTKLTPEQMQQAAQIFDEEHSGETEFTGEDLIASLQRYEVDMRDVMSRHYAQKRAQELAHTEAEPGEGEKTYDTADAALSSLYYPDIGPSSYRLYKSPSTGRFFGRGRYDTSGT